MPGKQTVQNLVKGYSIETTTREAARIARFSDIVPPGTRLYIVNVPGSDRLDILPLARRVRNEGLEPVPHIAVRSFENLSMLDNFLQRLAGEAGVRQILLIAGDSAPAGQLESTLQVLDSGILEKHGIRTIGVAGHPEGHPAVSKEILGGALQRKNAYARRTGASVYIVTQFTFAAEAVTGWEIANAADIDSLPIAVGLAGLATIKTLLKFAKDCGVGISVQAFAKRAGSFTKLLTVATPGDVIVGLAHYKERTPQTHIAGVHFFPFGGFQRTAEWANSIAAGNFEITEASAIRLAYPK
jgi:methylenetetrahydrofolate reductase (NADPH)